MYGTNKETRKLATILKLLDININYIIDDINEKYEWYDWVVQPYYQLLFEEKGKYKIVIADKKKVGADKLDELGLVARKDYNFLHDYKNDSIRVSILDPNLGYNFWDKKCEYPGFVQFGNEDSDYTICVLGGSTTDAALFPFKSWAEFLYENLMKRGFKIRILCGGCAGYKSSQELVKLERDVIAMKPDLIISYTGINDASQNYVMQYDAYPFVHHYQAELVEEVSKKIKHDCAYLTMGEAYTLGVKSDVTRWEIFTNNIKMMHSVSNTFGIKYVAFLQPCILTKEQWGKDEVELIINTELNENYRRYIQAFYDEKMLDMPEMLMDLTGIFDDVSDIYLDLVHVNEAGNKVIAEKIEKYILRGDYL